MGNGRAALAGAARDAGMRVPGSARARQVERGTPAAAATPVPAHDTITSVLPFEDDAGTQSATFHFAAQALVHFTFSDVVAKRAIVQKLVKR
jgi:hypothetical protein